MSKRAGAAGLTDAGPAGAVPLPSREEIMAFIARERETAGTRVPTKIGKREIARAFGLKGSDKIGLKRVLKDMEAEGTIERKTQGSHQAGYARCDRAGGDFHS